MCIWNVSSIVILALFAQAAFAEDYHPIHFVSDSLYHRLEQISTEKVPVKVQLRKVRDQFCSGRTPRLNFEYKTVYSPPHAPGMALDDAAELKKRSLDDFRQFLKKDFFYSTSDEEGSHVLGLGRGNTFFIPYADDMKLLVNSFTFKVSRPQIAKLTGYKNYSDESFSDNPGIQDWGYDFDSGDYKPSLAIKNAKRMWKSILGSQTTVLESPKANGDVNFTVKLDLTVFCANGIALTDLVSE
jgi:hypothetical protein